MLTPDSSLSLGPEGGLLRHGVKVTRPVSGRTDAAGTQPSVQTGRLSYLTASQEGGGRKGRSPGCPRTLEPGHFLKTWPWGRGEGGVFAKSGEIPLRLEVLQGSRGSAWCPACPGSPHSSWAPAQPQWGHPRGDPEPRRPGTCTNPLKAWLGGAQSRASGGCEAGAGGHVRCPQRRGDLPAAQIHARERAGRGRNPEVTGLSLPKRAEFPALSVTQ